VVVSEATEPEPVKWSIDIAVTGGKGTCLDKADGVLVDGKCVKTGRWEERVGCGSKSEMAETCMQFQEREKTVHENRHDGRCRHDQKTSRDNDRLDDMSYTLETYIE